MLIPLSAQAAVTIFAHRNKILVICKRYENAIRNSSKSRDILINEIGINKLMLVKFSRYTYNYERLEDAHLAGLFYENDLYKFLSIILQINTYITNDLLIFKF